MFPQVIKVRERHGYALIEIAVVIVLMSGLIVLAIPHLSAVVGNVRREGALSRLLSAFEYARVTALAKGVRTYVGIADMGFPVVSNQMHAFIIFREKTPEEKEAGEGEEVFVPMGGWKKLPKNWYFRKDENSLFVNRVELSEADLKIFPMLSLDDGPLSLSVLRFGSNGMIEQPSNPSDLNLYLYEAVRKGARLVPKHQDIPPERIRFRRFTGRAEIALARAD